MNNIVSPFEDDPDRKEEFENFVQNFLLDEFEKHEAEKRTRATILDYARSIFESRKDEFATAQAILEKHKVSEQEARLYFRNEGPVTKKKDFRLPRMVREDFNLLRRVCRIQDQEDSGEDEPVKIWCRGRSFETEQEARSYCYDHDVYLWHPCQVSATLRQVQKYFKLYQQLKVNHPTAPPSPSDPVDIYMEFWILIDGSSLR